MKKVLFTATVDSHILAFHIPFLKLFKEKGYEVHVATNGDADIPYCDVKHVVSFERSPFKLNNIKAVFELKKIINSENFEIIHTHTPMGSFVTRLAAINARKNSTRVIYTAHGFHFYKGAPILNWLLYYPIEKLLSRFTDTLITINKHDYELAKKRFSSEVHYIPGVGIDDKKFSNKLNKIQKIRLRKSIGLLPSDFAIIFPAELNKNKNQLWLIKSLADLINRNRRIHLILPGQDNLGGKCQKLTLSLGISSNIHFLGHRNDIPQLLSISDAAISSSIREGLPVNVMEAMYVGLPIIATDCRGNADLVVNDVNGFIIDPKSTKSAADAVYRIYSDSDQRKNFSKNNVIAIRRYMMPIILKDMESIYKLSDKNIKNTDKSPVILHILSSNRFSGAENVALGLIREKGGFYCSPDGQIRKTLEERGVEYVGIKKLSLGQISSVIKSLRPDFIYAHDFKASLLIGFFFGKKYKVISYIHQNPDWLDKINLKTLLYRANFKKFYKIIMVSKSISKRAIFNKYPRDNIEINYNKIDTLTVKKMAQETFDKKYDLCFVGRLSDVKQPDQYVYLISKIKDSVPNVKAVMVGDGELMDSIKKLIQDLDLSKNIEVVGFQKNPYKYINASKILTLTSKNEGLPMVILESIALGRCFISYQYPTLLDVFISKKLDNNFLCKDLNELSGVAIDLLKNKSYYQKIINNQRTAVARLYKLNESDI